MVINTVCYDLLAIIGIQVDVIVMFNNHLCHFILKSVGRRFGDSDVFLVINSNHPVL